MWWSTYANSRRRVMRRRRRSCGTGVGWKATVTVTVTEATTVGEEAVVGEVVAEEAVER